MGPARGGTAGRRGRPHACSHVTRDITALRGPQASENDGQEEHPVHQNFRRLDRPEREEIVLDAARDLFLTQGYSATKMSDLAAAAGVTPAALYGYFSSKDHALAAVQADVEASVMRQLPVASPMARLEAYLEIVRETSRPLHRMMHERAAHSDQVATVLKEVHRNIDTLIREAVSSYGITQPDEDRLVELCTAVIEGTNATRSPLHSSQLVRFAIERVRDATLSKPGSRPLPVQGERAAPDDAGPAAVQVHIEALDSEDIFAAVDVPTARRLLEVATSEFAAHGYGGTTTRRITSQAGLSSTALYAHFKTKEEMLHRISRLAHEQLLAAMRRASLTGTGSVSSYLSIVGTFIRFHVDHSTLARVIQYELRGLSRPHLLQVASYRRQIDTLIRSSIEAGVADGQFRCDDVAGTALAIESVAIDIARWHDAESTAAGRSAIVERYLRYSLALAGARNRAIAPAIVLLHGRSRESSPLPHPDDAVSAQTGTVE
ncbi:TetR family transcriptional regulator [Pseudonocardia sp. RS010]|uniref:TetR family transcriptional regulator n=1 Tax=Pseudonocardia sp. RS010 TaxID=3385979 RepID=UPI0039A2864B